MEKNQFDYDKYHEYNELSYIQMISCNEMRVDATNEIFYFTHYLFMNAF